MHTHTQNSSEFSSLLFIYTEIILIFESRKHLQIAF